MNARHRSIAAIVFLAAFATAGCGSDHRSSPPASTVGLTSTQPTIAGEEAIGDAAMCAEAVDVDGRLYVRDPFLRVEQRAVSTWTPLGPVVGRLQCGDTNQPSSGSSQPAGIAASGAPIGAAVYAVPTEPGVVAVDTLPTPLLYRAEHADPLAFTACVVGISIDTPELIEGESAAARQLSTVTDSASIDELMSELLAGDRIDSFHADNQFDFVVELVRDDGLVTSLGLDPHANVLNDRALGPRWAAAVAGLS